MKRAVPAAIPAENRFNTIMLDTYRHNLKFLNDKIISLLQLDKSEMRERSNESLTHLKEERC